MVISSLIARWKGLPRPSKLPEDRQWIETSIELTVRMLGKDHAAGSLADGRWTHLVADLAEANRRAQKALYEAIERALAEGETFESLGNASRQSPDYLRQAFEEFDPGMWAQRGPDANGREPWRVLG